MPDVRPLVCELLAGSAAADPLAPLFERDAPWSERVATDKSVARAEGYKTGGS
jgi:hypothetical protein